MFVLFDTIATPLCRTSPSISHASPFKNSAALERCVLNATLLPLFARLELGRGRVWVARLTTVQGTFRFPIALRVWENTTYFGSGTTKNTTMHVPDAHLSSNWLCCIACMNLLPSELRTDSICDIYDG